MIRRSRSDSWPNVLESDIISDGLVCLVRQPAKQPFLSENVVRVRAKWSALSEIEETRASVDAEAEKRSEECGGFAWDPEFGYVTGDPYLCGTGLEISATFHLEALNLIGDLQPALNGVDAMRLFADPLSGGGFTQAAHLFRIGNGATLGLSEDALSERVRHAFSSLVQQEQNARIRLVRELPLLFEDAVERALAILRNARLLSEWELLDVISPVRIAAELGFLDGFTRRDAEKMTRERMELPDDPPPQSSDEEDALDRRDHALASRMNKRFADVRLNARARDALS